MSTTTARTVLATATATLAAAALTAAGVATAPPAAAGGSAVTIEAGFSGSLTSHPDGHHTANNFRDAATGNAADWSADYGAAAGTPITPRLSGAGDLTLTVVRVAPSCSNGGGGTGVQVSVSEPAGEIGLVSYLHLADVAVSEGDVVSGDTVLGTVGGGFGYDESCWTGPHLHVEAYNRSDYSCYYAPASVSPGTAIGRIGGSDVGGRVTHCP